MKNKTQPAKKAPTFFKTLGLAAVVAGIAVYMHNNRKKNQLQ